MSYEIFYDKIRRLVIDPVQTDMAFHCWLNIVYRKNIYAEISLLNVEHEKHGKRQYTIFHCIKEQQPNVIIIPFLFSEEVDSKM